jgi:4-hydroxythreonine-4-phosphate dehydrogenase
VTIVYTCGDPLSINIEAFLRVVVPAMARHRAVVGIGSHWQLRHQAEALNLPTPPMVSIKNPSDATKPGVYWIDPCPTVPEKDARFLSDIERGRMAVAALECVPKKSPKPLAVLTAPVNKHCMSLAGFKFPGQTEFFETHWNTPAVMMLAGPKLRVALATNHLPLSKVTPEITSELILQKLQVTHRAAQKLFGLPNPKIAVCALNPHAGDHGLFGDEDQTVILPAIQTAAAQHINAAGPFPADTIFYRAYTGQFDVVLALYHDQGLGPLKTVHFDDAVNVSMGLPHLRVSPDHGPASDLYLTGRASVRSFDAALSLCEHWLNQSGVSS